MNLVYVINELMEKGKLLRKRREANLQYNDLYEQHWDWNSILSKQIKDLLLAVDPLAEMPELVEVWRKREVLGEEDLLELEKHAATKVDQPAKT